MSEQNEQIEQITADPEPGNKDTKKREKDPKKVAAGKKLAEYNKKAKEALAREMKREEEPAPAGRGANENTYSEAKSWLPELSFATVLSVVGLGFTAFDLFMRYREKAGEGFARYSSRIADLSQVPQIPQPAKIPLTSKSLGME